MKSRPDLNYGFGAAAPLIRKPKRRKERTNAVALTATSKIAPWL